MFASKRRASCSSNASMKFVGEIRAMIAAAVSAARLLWLHGSHEAYSMPLNLCFLGKIALGGICSTVDGGFMQYMHRNSPASIWRSEEHTSELQSLMRISYAVFCLKKKSTTGIHPNIRTHLNLINKQHTHKH